MSQIFKPLPEWLTEQLCDELGEMGFDSVVEPTEINPTLHIWRDKRKRRMKMGLIKILGIHFEAWLRLLGEILFRV